ncbi:MAG: hypothetical protein ACR2LG_04480 [Actinomycetota bacterium]|nr:hypothetical protein [Actinomycetota bacterium]
MVKSIFWVAVGAAGALQADRWMRQKRDRWAPSAVTGTLLDKVNRKLESRTDARPGSVDPRP